MIRSLARFGNPLVLALGIHISACSPATPAGSAGESQGVLTLGLLPDENHLVQHMHYQPLADAIKSSTGFNVRLSTPHSYEELVAAFSRGEIDAAYFGGYTFLLAEQQSGAVPLVVRNIDIEFISYVLVREGTKAETLSDLSGRSFSFGDRFSTSGHIMPRHFLRKEGIDPEIYFSEVKYSGAHDRTIQWFMDGTVDAGVANAQIVTRLLKADHTDPKAVRIAWQSPRYVDYVWAVQPTMSDETRQAIKEVFLLLDIENPEDRKFLEHVGADYYIPAAKGDFYELRKAVAETVPGLQLMVDSAGKE